MPDVLPEGLRLQRLHDIGILDTADDRLFRGFAEQALGVIPGACIAAIGLMDSGRLWFKTIIGMDASEIPRDASFCAQTIRSGGTMVVEDAERDDRFADNPLVVSSPNLRFYVGTPLAGGVGTLCVLGREPRQVTGSEIAKLVRLAHFVEIQLFAHGVLVNGAVMARPSGIS